MNYAYLIIPLIVAISSQAIKLATDGIKGNFSFKNFFITYGGMPSTHSALTASITTLLGLKIGFASPIFAVSLVFTIIVMRDAVTFRKILGEQLNRQLGHTTPQVLAGGAWGIIITYLLTLI